MMADRYLKPKNAFWFLVLLALLRGILYTVAVPPWEHPDEPAHFEHLRFFADTNRLPTRDDFSIPLRWEIVNSMTAEGFWTRHSPVSITDEALSKPGISPIGVYTFTHPRLYYILAGFWLKPWLGQPIELQVLIVRILSVLLNLIIVTAAYYSSKALYPSEGWLPIAMIAFIVFHPVQTDIMSAVNNDVLINLIGALFFLVTIQIFRGGLSIAKLTALVLLLFLGVLTKTTALVLIACLPIGVIFYLWRMGNKNLALGMVLVFLLFIMAAMILNQVEGPDQWIEEAFNTLGKYMRVNISGTIEALTKPEHQYLLVIASSVVFKSFWAVFGWRSVWVGQLQYWIIGVVSVASLGGLFKLAVKWYRGTRSKPVSMFRPSYLAFAASSILIGLFITLTRSLMVQGMSSYLSHGRYLLVAIIPFALLFVVGLSQWIPEAKLKTASIAYVAFLVLFDAISFWGFLVPAYY